MGATFTAILLTLCYINWTGAVRKNVLFLVSDDMRPQLGCYGDSDFPSPVHPTMWTPHLDGLASRSLLLKRAYCQQTLCSPSRTSLLTGRRPDTTHVYDLNHYFRKVGGNYTTIPQYFKEHGYRTLGAGKVFHPGAIASGGDDPISWTDPYYHAPNYNYWEMNNTHSWYAVPETERMEKSLPDEEITAYAIETLQKLAPAAKSGDQPFFLAVGYHKPHLPFVFPEEYSFLYPEPWLRLPPNAYAPVNMPPIAWWNYYDLRWYGDITALNQTGAINTTLPDDVVRNLRRAYYSCISYIDTQVGTVLKALNTLGLDNTTIVSFWGDHGWQLGEHGEWEKETNFELTTHAPMMIRVPGMTDEGKVTEALTEFVDLFPTLVEAADLPPLSLCPEGSTQTQSCREGSSLMPLMTNPNKTWKSAVFSQYPRQNFSIMGYTVRTDKARYTEWVGFNQTTYAPIWEKLNSTELYDHGVDPEENWNRSDDPKYASLRKSLAETLHSGWRHVLPEGTTSPSIPWK